MAWRWILSLTVIVFAGWPSWAVDRRPLAEAVYAKMPVFLKFVKDTSEFKSLPATDQEIFNKVTRILLENDNQLNFDPNPQSNRFNLKPGEDTRLMSSHPEDLKGDVFVNLTMLNQPNLEVDVPLLAKFFFHEIAHKIGSSYTWGDRDRVAQFFENALRPFVKTYVVNEQTKFTTVSLPTERILDELAVTTVNQAQPTYMLFVETDGKCIDLSPVMRQRLHESTTAVRTLWAEAHQLAFLILNQMGQLMKSQMIPAMAAHPMVKIFGKFGEQFQGLLSGMADQFAQEMNELRLFEINDLDVREVESGRQLFLTIKATYTISRTKVEDIDLPIPEFNDLLKGMFRPFPVPVVFHALVERDALPKLSPTQLYLQLRPGSDFKNIGKISSVIRENGEVAKVKVKVPNATLPVSLHLETHFPQGQLLVKAKEIESLGNGQFTGLFEIPTHLRNGSSGFLAESVLVDGERTIFLDRTVEIQGANSTPVETAKVQNAVVEGTFGFWGIKGSAREFRNRFSHLEPALLFDHPDNPDFAFSPSGTNFEFETQQSEKIREVRLHFRRMLAVSQLKPGAQIFEMSAQGKTWRVTNSVDLGSNFEDAKDIHEVISVAADEIQTTPLEGGRQKVTGQFVMPIKVVRELNHSGEVHGITVVFPLMAEVITENLQTLRVSFGQALESDSCNWTLEGGANFETSMNFTKK